MRVSSFFQKIRSVSIPASFRKSRFFCALCNILLVYLVFMLCRIAYAWENWSAFSTVLRDDSLCTLLRGSLVFDTAAIIYLNALYLVLLFLPLHWKEQAWWHRLLRWVWLLPNALAIVMNLCDAAYFPFTGRRTTATVFTEFSHEDNLVQIFSGELLRHWYFILFFVLACWGGYRAFRMPVSKSERPLWRYYLLQLVTLSVCALLCIGGVRGGFTQAVRPITISNANQYVSSPAGAALVLNTPFSIIRTLGKKSFRDPQYMPQQEMEALYSPVHHPSQLIGVEEGEPTVPADSIQRNVVILICESLGQEYYGCFNDEYKKEGYNGYTPFLDQLCTQSLTFRWSFANGRKSIDGMPSVLSSIPMFVEPFFLTSASMNHLSGIARELGNKGYSSAFFHGAQNGSMGFEAFAKATGFGTYYGRTEYDADERFGGEGDFDGNWAIWDEPFLQFYAQTMSSLREPFVTAVFTASSHHPFAIPSSFEKHLQSDEAGRAALASENPMHKCIRYLDHSLEAFFQTARKQPWFDHTLFVITGDHTNMTTLDGYQSDWGLFSVPVIFYDPSATVFPAERRAGVAQQIDIMPTLLTALHYDRPYVGFGIDLLTTPDSLTWAVGYNNGTYQMFTADSLFLQFDGNEPIRLQQLHDFRSASDHTADPVFDQRKRQLTRHLQSIIQSYMQRMVGDSLRVQSS